MKGYRNNEKKKYTTYFDKIFFKNVEYFLSKFYLISTSDSRCYDKFTEFKAYFDLTQNVIFSM